MEYSNSAMRLAIDEYVHNVQYRTVLYLRYCQGETYEQIGEKTNYSTQHIKHICNSYKLVLLSHL